MGKGKRDMTTHALLQYLKYRWNAKTRHGIHSPFVYAFIDNCLGRKSADSLQQRINTYFDGKIAWINTPVETLPAASIIAIKYIHKTAVNTQAWDALRVDKQFQLSIDIYHVGLLVRIPEVKEKQHFILKYPL
jgi:hypothetical protein